MSKRRKVRSSSMVIDRIDMTPLIDLTFLLLIVFMVTMPLLEYSTPVETPAMNAAPLPEENAKGISIGKDGGIIFQNETLTMAQLLDKLTSLHAFKPDTVLLVRGDKQVDYGKVIEVMRTIKQAGFDNPRLVTGAE